jgi:hypothetical protein
MRDRSQTFLFIGCSFAPRFSSSSSSSSSSDVVSFKTFLLFFYRE